MQLATLRTGRLVAVRGERAWPIGAPGIATMFDLIGAGHEPALYLQSGHVLESWVEGIGRLTNKVMA